MNKQNKAPTDAGGAVSEDERYGIVAANIIAAVLEYRDNKHTCTGDVAEKYARRVLAALTPAPQAEDLRSDGSTRASRQAEVDAIFEDANRVAARMGARVEPDPERIRQFVEGAPQPLQQGGEVTRLQVARIIRDEQHNNPSPLAKADAILALFPAPAPDLGDLAGLVRDVEALRDTFTIPQADDPRMPWNTLEEAARYLRSLAADRDKAVGLLRRMAETPSSDYDAVTEAATARAFLSSQTEES